MRLALQNNERARKAPLRVEIAEGQLDRARDAFFPTLVGSGVSIYKPDPPARSPNLTTSGSVTLTQPLLNPSAFPQYSQQRHNVEAEKWGSLQDKRQLAFDTAKAFTQTLALEGVLNSAKRKADTAKLNLDAARARADAGLASTNDVTKTELQLATSLGQVATAQGNVEKTYISLSFLVGQKVAGPLVAPDNTTRAAQRYEESQRNQVKSALDRRAEALKAAQNRRPDLRSLHEKTEALRYSAKEPLYRLIPSISAAGQIRFVPDPLPSEKTIDEQVSVNLTWPIFDAGFRYADRRQRIAQVSALIGGNTVGKFTTGGRRIDVRMRLLAAQRTRPEDLSRIQVRTQSGDLVPMSLVVSQREQPVLQTISHLDRERAISISGNVGPGHSQAEAMAKVMDLGKGLPLGLHVVATGQASQLDETTSGLWFALGIGILVAYMVLASQFNSFLHPITVLTILPLAVAGAVVGLVVSGKSLNLFSMIGVLLLMGIVKKNSILLVEYANQVGEHEPSLDAREAMKKAGPLRLRPILMTTVATMMSAVPPILGLGPGTETRSPMAAAVLGGLTVSTILSLVVVPAFYVVADRTKNRLATLLFRKKRAPDIPGALE